ncbi:MAG TPA: metal-dependent hydrolase [Sneathiellales bacterium]|nr:metal-dependent hydrolase [Sneathiellales bacterium]
MAQRKYEYQPKEVDQIVIRAFAFEFPDDLDPIWVPDNPVRSHMLNGISLTMPYLEPYLILSNKEAMKTIDDPDILADMRAFNGQEGCHYQCHRSLNEILKTNGYPELARVEERMDASFERLKKKSLRTQLAYNAGFETMTNGFTHWLINQRTKLFRGASPHVTSFWLMHMVEETEHKTVAFDAYMAYSGQYFPRAIGVFHGSFHLLGWGLIGTWAALKKDKALRKPSNVWSLVREVSALAYHVTPYIVRSLRPWHNPRCEDDPQWMKDWLKGHATLPRGALIPLIDTDSDDMPVPF